MADSLLIDPLGRSIILHDHTWYGHILPNHHEVAAHRALAEKAVVDPLEIRFSAADINCRIYFGDGPRPGTMLLVVADIALGLVKTAHFAKGAKGMIEWSRPTP